MCQISIHRVHLEGRSRGHLRKIGPDSLNSIAAGGHDQGQGVGREHSLETAVETFHETRTVQLTSCC
jgi:hypothetical protein